MTVTEERSHTRAGPPRATGRIPAQRPLPRELVRKFRPHADIMAKAINYEIQRADPEYPPLLEGPFGGLLAGAVEDAVRYAVDKASGEDPAPDRCVRAFRRLGEAEFRAGRDLNFLHNAYRTGGWVAWRHLADFGQAHGAPTGVLCDCADAIFGYVDGISRLSMAGYNAARAEESETIARHRRELLGHILTTPPTSPHTLGELATAARWNPPEWITMVALEPGPYPRLPSIDADVLLDLDADQPCLLTTDPELDGLDGVLTGRRAAVGPTVRLRDAASSLRWARQAMDLLRRGVIPDAPVVRCADHLGTLWLLGDPLLLSALRSRSLAPLDGLTAKQRTRLCETLLAWLRSRGGAPELAAKLGVHPQTVRYRMRQLTELFGDRLDDPDERLSMEITLRAEQLTADR